jgi:ubiquinone/menaquinone biosynthesis C-methylase UbiE
MGVDMTPEMLERARRAASARGNANVEFREGILEKLPVESLSVDAVLSNCVINLSPDKDAAFAEAYRALRAGGRLVLSDIVLDRPLTAAPTCGCVENADFRGVYLSRIRRAGFDAIEVVEDRPWSQEDGTVVASSVTLRATKPKSATH